MSATTKPKSFAAGTKRPVCNLEIMTNGQITWRQNGHVRRERKTALIRSTPQNNGQRRSCKAAIVWAMTKNGRHMPMNRDFDVIGREGALGMMLRVYTDQSHFVTCPNARRHRKGGHK